MGLKDLIKGQLLQSINYHAENAKELAALYDRDNRRIMYGSVLTVMPGQAAVLVNEGTLADIFMPGRYELETSNMPITTTLKEWKMGFNESFVVDIIFVNMNEIIDIPWGTSEQLTLKDETFGLVNLGANGKYSYQISDPGKFIQSLMGTKSRYTVDDLKGFATSQIAMLFKETVTEKQMDFFDIQSYCAEASELLKVKGQEFFGTYGITINKMNVQVALPETVKAAINERSTVGAMGGMNMYAAKKQADAMMEIAKNPGSGNSVAGMGVQMSAGMAMAGMMNQNMANMNGQGIQPQASAPAANQAQTMACPSCHAQIPAGVKFCPECGKSTQPAMDTCGKCGAKVPQGSKFCPECGASMQDPVCPKCGKAAPAGTKFCPECGEKLV